jgi:hypothetical protein
MAPRPAQTQDDTLETIFVSVLTRGQALTGNIHEAIAHMNGLHRLASLWRAQSHSPIPYDIDYKLVAAAIKLSILTNTPPSIPFNFTFKPHIPQPLPGLYHILPELGAHLLEIWAAMSSVDSVIPTINDLVTMTRYTEAVHQGSFPYLDENAYMDYINFQNMRIEHRLLSYQACGTVDAACRTACLLYLNTVLVRGWSNNTALTRTLVRQLRAVLTQATCKWDAFEQVLLWVTFVGATCSHEPADERFFTTLFESAAAMLHLQSVEDAGQVLSKFLYVERIHECALNRIWLMVKY